MNRDVRRLIAEAAAVAAAATALALGALGVSGDWARGVLGGFDAWQNLWNLQHVDAALRGKAALFFTGDFWAPEGASLLAHTLSLPNTVPGAVLARATGFFLSYNLLVLASYPLAAGGLHLLARTLGCGAIGSALGALAFAFTPQRSARAMGHLNLLGIGWLPLALAALLLACRARRRGPLLGAAAGVALALLAYGDWYLAVLGAVAAVAFAAFEIVRAERRAAAARACAAAAAVSLALVAPYAVALARESGREGTVGHQARWCSSACTSLFVPSPVQQASSWTRPLTERNHQNAAEGASYLGLVPLAALVWVSTGRRRERALDPALAAGAVALVLALGPVPRVFDRLLDVPLPYAALERLVPALRVGGCVNRYIALVHLPLALAVAFAADRLLRAKGIGPRAALAAGALVLAFEYAPRRPGVAVFPLNPPDPGMVGIAGSPRKGNVLDVDGGIAATIRQLRHGRPQIFGYISRTPPASLQRRLDDPVLGPLLDPRRPALALSPGAAAFLLRSRWNVAFVVTPDVEPYRSQAAAFHFPLAHHTPGLSLVYRVPDAAPAPLTGFRLTESADTALGPERGLFTWGMGAPATVDILGRTLEGRWSGAEGRILAPLAPGAYTLELAAPHAPTRVALSWGKGRSIERTVEDAVDIPLAVAAEDLPAGAFDLTIRATSFPSGPAVHDSVFVISLLPEAR